MKSIDEARAEVEERAQRIRGRRRMAAGGALGVFAAAMVVLVVLRAPGAGVNVGAGPDGPASTALPPAPSSVGTSATTTPPGSDLAAAAIEQQIASGWVRYSAREALSPEDGGDLVDGYLKWGEPVVEPGKAKVYDRPNGVVVGYAYSQLGFVPLDQDAGFDAAALRAQRFGCDPFTDSTCAQRRRETAGLPQPGEPPLCGAASSDITTGATPAAPGHVAVDVSIRNTGSAACSVPAGALIALYSPEGIAMSFEVHISSADNFVHLEPGASATFSIDKQDCTAGDQGRPATVEMQLGGQRVRSPLPPDVDLAWCGRGDPGSKLTVTLHT